MLHFMAMGSGYKLKGRIKNPPLLIVAVLNSDNVPFAPIAYSDLI